jgi:hypothetical protein
MAGELLKEAKEGYEQTGCKTRLFGEDVYEASSWDKKRRGLYKAEVVQKGTNTRFVLTTKSDAPKALYEFYVRRGEGENWIKDFKLYVKADRLSCHRFVGQPVQVALARRCLLVDGFPEEEIDQEWLPSDATGHPALRSHQDRGQGEGADDEGAAASGIGSSGAKFMARSFGSLRKRS